MSPTIPSADRRAVITGIGVVAPTGQDRESWWSATRAGNSGIERIARFDPSRYPVTLAGEVRDFEPGDHLDQRLIKQTDRWTWMALVAAQAALDDAGFDPAGHDPYSMSVITASSSGGNEFGQREIQALWEKGPVFVGAYQSIAWFYAATTGQISIKHGMKGPSGVVLAEGAGSLEALAHSRRTIRRGVETAVSGGIEAPIGPYALTCQLGTGFLSTESDPAAAYRPFDARANGYVPGEGGAILLVESLESAQQRSAPQIYGEILGYGATNDAHHWGKPAPDAEQSARAMSVALKNAGISPGEVDAVVADAFGVPEIDALEVQAIRTVFGEHAGRVPVLAPKSGVGRMYAGGASLDAAAALLCMRDGTLPPIVNLEEPADGFELDFVRGSERRGEPSTILVNARGFGGFNSALVLRRMT
ncbi:MAG TPA: beta-ketoacyl synthase N-terminal-like domain-containing protein [Solirubrobacteraceae bacterium]|jgi:minimal PKS chain-length factor (CLF/KS beta)|nr:beta-ketoacyl synthase N-terminal-like domain-containing protein [Solirubrobacteraceae bacterium]